MLSPSIDFLSHDQKVVLAQRSSMVSSQQPGAFGYREEDIASNLSQAQMLKKNFDAHTSSTFVEDARRQPANDTIIPQNSTDLQMLHDFNERMNDFQNIIQIEVKTQDEDQMLHNHKRKQRTLWGVCIFIFLLVFMISLVVPLAVKSSHTGQDNSPPNLESPFDIDECYSGNFLDQQQYHNFHTVITSYYPNMLESIDTSGTSANIALCWLSQYDNMNLNPFVGDAAILAQRFVLSTLYFHFLISQNATRNHGIFSNENWLSMEDVCNWTLVGCQETGSSFRYVTSLDFSGQWIENIDIPSEIALLQNLSVLNLDPINFQGTIPSELISLTLLEEFRVTLGGSNSMSGSGKVMETWKRLETLSLDLAYSASLPDFSVFTNMRHLIVKEKEFRFEYTLPELRKLTKLETLDLRIFLRNEFPTQLLKLSSLDFLFLKFSSETIIPTGIGNLSKLRYLTLTYQSMRRPIPSEIGTLSKLTYLYLYLSDFTGSIPSEIGNLSKLDTLQIISERESENILLPSEICSLSGYDFYFEPWKC